LNYRVRVVVSSIALPMSGRDDVRSENAAAVGVPAPAAPRCVRFEEFEFDLRTEELRKAGQPIRLPQQPLRVLRLLALRRGELVTRADIRDVIWGDGTFVDFELGLRRCITEIRAALGDDARAPRFIETLPKRGYRFLASVEEVTPSTAVARPQAAPTATQGWARAARLSAHTTALALGIAAVLASVFWPQATGHRADPELRRLLLVLPFEDLRHDPEQAYLADGMTDELIVQLGRLRPAELGVIARTTAMRFRGQSPDVASLRRELGVDHVVEGSVMRDGQRVRVRVKLIDTTSRSTLWAQNFEEDGLGNVLAMQAEVAQAVAHSVQATLARAIRAHGQSPVDPQAYESYLRGLYFFNQRTEDGLTRAGRYLGEAIGRQPDFAPAHAVLAQVYFLQTDRALIPPNDGLPRMRAEAEAALRLDPDLAEAHVVLAVERLLSSWDWPGAERSYRRAIAVRDNYATAHHWYGTFLANLRRFDEARAEIRRAMELDPLSLVVNQAAALIFLQADRLDESEAQVRKVLEMDQRWPLGRATRARLFIKQGRALEAVDSMEALASELGDGPGFLAYKTYAYACAGQDGRARRTLGEIKALASSRSTSSAYELAAAYSAVGERELALEALERALEERHPQLRYVAVDERLESLHGDARFADVVRRVGLPASAVPPAR
jgi:TolB-like protein/DNA-binding winged helix-turn-helix (wHTH) protein/Tfp pilus assembly protein PilF